ncbi:TPCN1 isoform 24, partial [Pan troglodytes]
MAVSLDDDVPLILTLDEGGSAPLAPSNGLGQEELPSKRRCCMLCSSKRKPWIPCRVISDVACKAASCFEGASGPCDISMWECYRVCKQMAAAMPSTTPRP